MQIQLHPSVQRVIEFMQRTLPADELRGVSEAMPAVAAVLWSDCENKQLRPMRLVEESLRVGGGND